MRYNVSVKTLNENMKTSVTILTLLLRAIKEMSSCVAIHEKGIIHKHENFCIRRHITPSDLELLFYSTPAFSPPDTIYATRCNF